MSEAAKNTSISNNSKNSVAGPPKLCFNLPSRKDVTTTSKQPDLPIDVLLVTVRDGEFLACYSQLKDPVRYYYKDLGYVYFNDVQSPQEKVKVALVQCREGSTGPNSSLIAVTNAARILRPKAVISVGACSGLNPDKTKLGDVVVSAKLSTYASKVVTSDQDQSAGMRSYVSRLFLKIIPNCADGWQAPLMNSEDCEIKVHFDGEFLSGPEQIKAEKRRKELADLYPLAAGVEMEGQGVFTAAFDTQLEWLIVKGIADYADGEQRNAGNWKAFASALAASLVSHILNNPAVFLNWPHFPVDTLSDAQSESDSKRKLTEHQSGVPTRIKERIRQLYKRREGRLKPFPWCDDLNFNLNDIFTRLKIVMKEKTRGTLTDDEITNLTAMFTPHPECQKPRIVLIEGDPGMGKTTYSQKLAYDWANEQDKCRDASFPELELLLLLRCNDVKSDIWVAIDDQILPDDVDEQAKEMFFKYIKENQSKVLLLLDGLDEADHSNLEMYYSLVKSKLLSDCHIVITSRHEVGKKVRPFCDTLWEIVGFTDEDAISFIRKFFQGKEHLANKLIKRLHPIWDRNDNPLETVRELTKNPLNTTLLCCLFEDFNGVLPPNRTQLYVEIVLFILRRYEEKKGLSSDNEDLISVYSKELLLLGSFALESLLKGELYFEKGKEIVFSINFGFLSFQEGGTKRKPIRRCAFLHKSFQEFFAGFYLAFQIINKEIDCASVLADDRYLDEMRQVFLFMSGIIAFKSKETAVSFVINISRRINLLLRTHVFKAASYMFLASESLLECSSFEKNLKTRLVCTMGNHLDMSCLTNLYLHDRTHSHGIRDVGAAVISKALTANSSLTSLDLIWNRIGDTGASSLSQALTANSSLTTLILRYNRIGDTGACSLSQALTANSSLTTLDLSDNGIGDTGACSLSQSLTENSTLTNLYLGRNGIGVTGACSLSQALTANSSLTTLDLRSNSIGDTGASSLSQALTANSSLTRLILSYNRIGDTGACSLSQALTANSSLTTLVLIGNGIGDTGNASLLEARKNKRVIRTISDLIAW